jgi:hypothetical protein
MMCSEINNAASCEIRSVICFLRAKGMSAAEIHRELCATVYGQNVMSEGTARQRCRMFKNGRTDIHDGERSGRSAICSE